MPNKCSLPIFSEGNLAFQMFKTLKEELFEILNIISFPVDPVVNVRDTVFGGQEGVKQL